MIPLFLAACHVPSPPPGAATATFRFQSGARPHAPAVTFAAVPIETERGARFLEALDVEYVGELGLMHGTPNAAEIALEAASHGATHYRTVLAEDDGVRVVLYRLDRGAWSRLPESLRPSRCAVLGRTSAL